jgi:hypothetical protein
LDGGAAGGETGAECVDRREIGGHGVELAAGVGQGAAPAQFESDPYEQRSHEGSVGFPRDQAVPGRSQEFEQLMTTA